MQTKAKANSIITHELTEAGLIKFNVRDAGSFLFNPARCAPGITRRAALHGFIQRISDGGALGRDPETGVAASPGDKMARMQRIAEHLETSDEWNMKPAGGGQTEGGLVILGIVRAGLAPDVDAANQFVVELMAKRKIERAAALAVWADVTEVAEAIAQIRAERAAAQAAKAKVSAADLLGEMGYEVDVEEDDVEDDAASE